MGTTSDIKTTDSKKAESASDDTPLTKDQPAAAEPAAEEFSAEESGAPDQAATPVRADSAAILPGAGAVVGAALGLASLTGTWAGQILAERQTLVGQIKLQGGQSTDQIGALYATPWHTHALVNTVIAVLALAVGGIVLALRPRAPWIKAVAWGGLVLGGLGLILGAGMYLDVFAPLPEIPAGAGGGAGGAGS